MRIKDLIQPLTGIRNIVVKGSFPDSKTNGLVISARPTKKVQCRCGICHRKAKYYDAGH